MTEVTIAERSFDISDRYAAGDTLTDAEANALNQTLRENVRNNLAKKLPEDDDEAQAMVTDYAGAYVFGQRTGGGGGGQRDPVKSESLRIAKDMVRKAIQKKGYKLDQFSAKDITERAQAELAKHPEWIDVARTRVAEQKELAASTLADIEVEASAPASA